MLCQLTQQLYRTDLDMRWTLRQHGLQDRVTLSYAAEEGDGHGTP